MGLESREAADAPNATRARSRPHFDSDLSAELPSPLPAQLAAAPRALRSSTRRVGSFLPKAELVAARRILVPARMIAPCRCHALVEAVVGTLAVEQHSANLLPLSCGRADALQRARRVHAWRARQQCLDALQRLQAWRWLRAHGTMHSPGQLSSWVRACLQDALRNASREGAAARE